MTFEDLSPESIRALDQVVATEGFYEREEALELLSEAEAAWAFPELRDTGRMLVGRSGGHDSWLD